MQTSLCVKLTVIVFLLGVQVGCNARNTAGSDSGSALSGGAGQGGEGRQASDAAFLPDPTRTPGDTLDVTKEDVCRPGYSHLVRNVPTEVKRQVYADYGVTHHQPGEYEVDHLISLELGGSNRPKNLWPQPYNTHPWNAHVKDKLENELHREVCSGQLDLKTAQQWISEDWITAYKRVFHTDKPLSGSGVSRGGAAAEAPAPAADAEAKGGGHAAQVWVNTKSGKYFLPGARYYGRTKQGEYLSEDQAIQQGYRAAQGQ